MSFTFAAALLGLVHPYAGLLAYLGVSILSPHSFTWDFASTFPHAQVLAITTTIGYLLSKEPKRLPWNAGLVVLALLWMLFGVSTIYALRPDAALDRLASVSKVMFMAFLAVGLARDERRVHNLAKTIAVALGLYSLKAGLFVLRTGAPAPVVGPTQSYLFAENAIGMALAANLPLLVYLRRTERSRLLRALLLAMILLTYPAVIGSHSRGAWMALATVSLILIFRFARQLLVPALIGAVLASLTGIGPSLLDRMASDRARARFDLLLRYEQDRSAQSRLWSWEFCARVGFSRPFYGGGFDFYSLETEAQFFPEFLDRWPGWAWSCHSMWLTILGDHGLPAFLLWVWLIGWSFLALRRRRHRAGAGDRGAAELAVALATGLLAFAVAGTFLDVAYFELLHQFFALIIALDASGRRAASALPTPSAGRGRAPSSARIVPFGPTRRASE
jgi:probable O-glycosylation ligase (exosortase A-associated)